MKYSSCFFFFLLVSQLLVAQQVPFEYMGAIKLNDSSFISYKVVFEELDGVVKGYSISDLGGAYETKSSIEGVYNEATSEFNFRELDIVYTKSPLDNFDMCLVHFDSYIKRLKTNKDIKGPFKGKYVDDKPCLNGDIFLTNMVVAVERAKKLDKKLQKSKKISQDVKEKFSAAASVDTLTQSTVKNLENLNVFAKGNEVILSIYDSGKVDGDRINLFVNDRLVLDNFTITAEKQKIILKRQKEPLRVKIVALDEGSSAPNTVKIEALDKNNLMSTRTLLKTLEEASLTFIFK